MTSRFNPQPITPGQRPNERQNPELEVLLRQVSPKLNAEVEPMTQTEGYIDVIRQMGIPPQIFLSGLDEPMNTQAAVEAILGKELAEGVTPMPETLAQQIRAEINDQFAYPDPAKHGAEDDMIDDEGVEAELIEYDEDGVEPELI